MRKKQLGFLAPELLIVLVLFTLLSAYAATTVNGLKESLRSANLKSDMASLREDIKDIYSSRPDYAGLNTQIIQDFDVVPPSFKNFSGPGGSTINISADGANNRFFTIEFSSFKDADQARAACINLIPGRPTTWDSILINGTSVHQGEFAEAANACSSANRMALRGQ